MFIWKNCFVGDGAWLLMVIDERWWRYDDNDDEWMNEWMKERKNERTNERTHACMHEWMIMVWAMFVEFDVFEMVQLQAKALQDRRKKLFISNQISKFIICISYTGHYQPKRCSREIPPNLPATFAWSAASPPKKMGPIFITKMPDPNFFTFFCWKSLGDPYFLP